MAKNQELLAHTQRMPKPLRDKIDARASRHGMTRTEWINRACERVVSMPDQKATVEERF